MISASLLHTRNYKEWFILLFLPLTLAAFATRNLVLLIFWFVAALIYIALNVKSSFHFNRATLLIGVSIFCVTAIFPLAVIRNLSAIFHYAVLIITIMLAYFFSQNKVFMYRGVALSIFGFQAVVGVYLLTHWFNEAPLDDMIPDSSGNGITSYLVVLQVCFSALAFELHRRIAILSSILTLGICIVGFGRGSLVAAIMICILNLSFFVLLTRRMLMILVPVLIVCALTFGEVLFDSASQYLMDNTKLVAGFEDNSRQEMLSDYLNKIDSLTFITGAQYEGTSINDSYGGNPHNSYIRAHHIFGFLYLIAIGLSAFSVVICNKTLSVKIYVCGLLLVLFIRAFTEPILFPSLLDIFYYLIIFSLVLQNRDKNFNERTPLTCGALK